MATMWVPNLLFCTPTTTSLHQFTDSLDNSSHCNGMCLRAFVVILTICTTISMHYGWLRPLHTRRSRFTHHHLLATTTAESGYEQRFANVARLYSSPSNPAIKVLQRMQNTHVCIIGLGGVGSWVAESLARNGINKLTLIDTDDVCISNTNRQVMAQTSSIGMFKAECLKSRILDINPDASVQVVLDFVRPENALSLLTRQVEEATLCNSHDTALPTTALLQRFDYVVDAVDSASDKAAIINACVCSNTPVVTCGGVGGLTDPTLLTISDLAQAEGDSLLYKARRTLRREYGYPSHREKQGGGSNGGHVEGGGTIYNPGNMKNIKVKRTRKWGILAVHTLPTGVSRTPTRSTQSSEDDDARLSEDSDACSVNSETSTESSMRTCDGGLGNTCFVTATVGMLMSSCIVNAVGYGPNTGKTSSEDIVQYRGKLAVRPRQLGKHFAPQATSPVYTSSVREHEQLEEHASCRCGKQEVASTAGMCEESADMTAQKRLQQEHTIHALLISSIQSTPLEPVFDAHCHLQLPPLHTHVSEALQLARACNITHLSVCGTSPQDWQRVRALYETYPITVIPSFGLHPWYINSYLSDTDSSAACSAGGAPGWQIKLEQLLQHIPTAGVGECGLDKAAKTLMDDSAQEHVLRAHIQLAIKCQRVLTLHCVSGCWDRLLHILTQYQKKDIALMKAPGREAKVSSGGPAEKSAVEFGMPSAIILHSCNSLPLHLVPHFARLHNTFFSVSMGGTCVGGGAGYSEKVVSLVKSIPPQRLLLETDSPDQLPSNLRMKVRNTNSSTEEAVHPAQHTQHSTTRTTDENSNLSVEQLSPELQYNEPALLQYHCKKLGDALGVSYEQLAAQTYENTCRAYGVVQVKH